MHDVEGLLLDGNNRIVPFDASSSASALPNPLDPPATTTNWWMLAYTDDRNGGCKTLPFTSNLFPNIVNTIL